MKWLDSLAQPLKDVREEITLSQKWETLHLHAPSWTQKIDFSKYTHGCLVDVGFHYGLVSVYFVQQTNQSAHGFEVNPRIIKLVQSRLQKSPYAGKITLHEYGLSDQEGMVQSYSDTRYSGATTIQPEQIQTIKEVAGLELRKKEKVPVKRLDDVPIPEPIALIKIDVEGNEHAVIRGALATLKKYHPDVLFEALTDDKRAECEKTLKKLGYTIRSIDERNYLAERV